MDVVFIGPGEFQAELDAESYHLDAKYPDPERDAVTAWMTANLTTKIAAEETRSGDARGLAPS